MKKLFGGLNLTWPRVIEIAINMGIFTGLMAMIPLVRDSSFTDLTATFEVWILFGILIIMNCKSPLDSALKCFVFFLISQPLIYWVQDAVFGSNLFNTYYGTWFVWTILCLPMGYIGHYLKKDKWWGLIILTPVLVLLAICLNGYIHECMFSFPRHILTVIFCIITLIIYPLAIFKDKKLKYIGLGISGLLIIWALIINILNPAVYDTQIISNSEEHPFDDKCNVYLIDSKYGDLSISYHNGIDDWMIDAKFKRRGDTQFVLECPNKEKRVYNLSIKMNTYNWEEVKGE